MASFLTTPQAYMETILAGLADFRTWCGAADEAEAKSDYIFSYDAVTTQANLPDKFASIGDLDGWSKTREAEGSGSGISGMMEGYSIDVYFMEDLGADVNWTSVNVQAFLDNIAAFVTGILNNTDGIRVQQITQVPFSDSFRMRGVDKATGNKLLQYAIRVTTRT